MQSQKVKEKLIKELEEKRCELKEAKLSYLKSNIELMDMVHQPLHQSSPVNRWSTKSFIEKKVIQPILEEQKTNEEPIINIETMKTQEQTEIKEQAKEEPIKEVNQEQIKAMKSTIEIIEKEQKILNEVIEEPKKEIEQPKEDSIKQITQEELLLDILTSKINSIRDQLTFTKGSSTTNDNEIKLYNISSKYLEPTISFLMLYHINKDINSYTNDQIDFLSDDICFLSELLLTSDYMMMEVKSLMIV